MSELPRGWAAARIGDLVTISPKNDCSDSTEVGFIPMSRMGTRFRETPEFEPRKWSTVKKGYTHFADGDVLLARITPCFENGKGGIPRGLPNGLGAGSTEFFVLRPKPNALKSEYLLALLKSDQFANEGRQSMTGAVGQQRVTKSHLTEFVVELPPYMEQGRIAKKLGSVLARVDACRDRLDRIPQILKRFREAVLEAAVTGRLTEEWRASNPHTVSAEEQVKGREQARVGRLRVRQAGAAIANLELGDLPDGWSWISNHRLAEDSEAAICAGPFGTIFKAKDFRAKGVPIIFLRHVAPGRFLKHKPGFMDLAVWRELHQPYSVRGGELLVTKLGDPPGTACIFPRGDGIAMVTPDVMKMSVDEAVASPEYLMHFFNSKTCKLLVEKLAFGVTRLRIDLSMFKSFPIPLPPGREQREIVRRVDELFALADALGRRYQAAVERVVKLTPAVLAKAFRGELAPQDPKDEAANKVLERIRAERDVAHTQSRPGLGPKEPRKRRSSQIEGTA